VAPYLLRRELVRAVPLRGRRIGGVLALRNPRSREIFQRFLLRRQDTESTYIQARKTRRGTGFHAFTRRRLDLFHRLAPDTRAAAGG
jgi:hypothetical protein